MQPKKLSESEKSLRELVAELPEVYQPIFGYEEYSSQASRVSKDRFEVIKEHYLFLSEREGRPLNVLDLGCAQGFFSFSLAELGAKVTGIDYSQSNINMCLKLLEIHHELDVGFRLDSIENFVGNIKTGEYDLVLGLSIFHHLIHEHGLLFVKSIMSKLVKSVENGFFEFALSTEPLYWAKDQPDSPRSLLDQYFFKHCIGLYPTHLSEVNRPIYFSSNKYWRLEKIGGSIDLFKSKSHDEFDDYHNSTRSYIHSGNLLIKHYIFSENNLSNQSDLHNERDFLSTQTVTSNFPKMIHFEEGNGEAFLVRELLQGNLLTNTFLLNSVEFDKVAIIGDLVTQLAELERNGKYHNDVRSWNVIVDQRGRATLIDYGSISNASEDGNDLYDQIYNFIILVYEIFSWQKIHIGDKKPLFLTPLLFSGRIKAWLSELWQVPGRLWSFGLLEKLFEKSSNHLVDASKSETIDLIPGILESQLSAINRKFIWYIEELSAKRIIKLESELRVSEAHAQNLEGLLDGARLSLIAEQNISHENWILAQESQNTIKELKNHINEVERSLQISQSDLSAMHLVNHHSVKLAEERGVQLSQLRNSRTKKITAPLRWVFQKIFYRPRSVKPRNDFSALHQKIIIFFLKKGIIYYKQSDFFRRSSDFLLNRLPALKSRLHFIYLKDRLGVTSAGGQLNGGYISTAPKNVAYTANGVNADQRSPLESYIGSRGDTD